ncbi:NRAMP family protein [Croceitalea dokdonensis DOKDO 023]|uniref:NRAMP family protein n=1 Tax=Croceitalea dokdonensis DOKDO 023 TaxID=1300341 RepID=A0A0P7ADV7_9FLAO|nr:divalent metal cation transporter [Croceitalea dokdonensis]KPM31392.1 NRAMP family protein [Croceitalea dokdonensis DOKDO 023]
MATFLATFYMEKLKAIVRQVGPGLLFASMAIGTSHLVLSTKAGAAYGFIMIVPILLANLLKYPFFEFGVRYTNATKSTLIEGYHKLGKGYLWFYAFITLISVFTILAALYIVTAGLLSNLLELNHIATSTIALYLFLFVSVLLVIGKYRLLEISLKWLVSLLFMALLLTTILVLKKGPVVEMEHVFGSFVFDGPSVLFLISLMGWMPTAVEASGWVSMWSIEKMNTSKEAFTLKTSLQEFNIGYAITSVLAVFFLIIGCYTLYGTSTELSSNSAIFAHQLVNLFTTHLGNWAYLLIAIAAFATMFSTCMTAHDAVSRVSLDVLKKLFPKSKIPVNPNSFGYLVFLLALINWIVINAFGANMGSLVALATFVSFVFAPIIGWMNLKAVTTKELNSEQRPKLWLRILAYVGIIFLSAFAIYYCWLVWFMA